MQQELPPPQQTDSPLDQVAAEQHQHSVQQLHEIPTGVQNNSQQQIVETQHWPQRRGTSQPKLRRLTQGHSVQHVRPQRNEDVLEASQHIAQGSGHRDASPQQDPLSGGDRSQPILFNIALVRFFFPSCSLSISVFLFLSLPRPCLSFFLHLYFFYLYFDSPAFHLINYIR